MSETTATPSEAIKPSAPGVEPYIEAFDALEKSETGQVPPWIGAQRTAGISHFAEKGFPTAADEDYKYPSLVKLADVPVSVARQPSAESVTEATLAPYTLRHVAAGEIVIVDGHYIPQLSVLEPEADKIKFQPLNTAIRGYDSALEKHLGHCACVSSHSLCALNTALFLDGAYLYVPRNTVVRGFLHVLHLTTKPGTVNNRSLIVAEPHSALAVVETFASLWAGEGESFTNQVTEAVVGEGANLKHVKLGLENEQTWHTGLIHADLARSARLANHSFCFGSKLTRNDIQFCLHGEGIDCLLNGLYLPGQGQTMDHHTTVDHAEPHCESHEFYHGILNGNGHGVFNGKIFVRPDAQKTDAKQSNRAILLSKDATIDTKPQLEIWADDVKCTHGATVG